jgi:hypothetical protein
MPGAGEVSSPGVCKPRPACRPSGHARPRPQRPEVFWQRCVPGVFSATSVASGLGRRFSFSESPYSAKRMWGPDAPAWSWESSPATR